VHPHCLAKAHWAEFTLHKHGYVFIKLSDSPLAQFAHARANGSP